MSQLLQRKFHDGRSVLILTVLCDRRDCLAVDAAAVPTDEVRAYAQFGDDRPVDFREAIAILHGRGWQTGKPCRCPEHVMSSWKKSPR